MLIRNFIIFIVLCVSPLLAQTEPLKTDGAKITSSIKTVANSENIPNSELEKAYIAYMGAYQYGKLMEFDGCEDFAELFDKMRLVTTRLKYVPNNKLSDAAYAELKYFENEDIKFDDQHKAEFLDVTYYIAEGLKAAIEKE